MSSQYSKNLRALVNDMLATNPKKRPDIEQILRKSFVQTRVKEFVSDLDADELHRQVLFGFCLLSSQAFDSPGLRVEVIVVVGCRRRWEPVAVLCPGHRFHQGTEFPPTLPLDSRVVLCTTAVGAHPTSTVTLATNNKNNTEFGFNSSKEHSLSNLL